jgi:RP/EB family microtubule-associated protein
MSRKSRGVTETGAKFLGRCELLEWINKTLDLHYKKVEDTANGAAFCQLMDMWHPGSVPLARVSFGAHHPHECMENLKILQEAFVKTGQTEPIDVAALAKGRYTAALHLLQYLYSYHKQLGFHGVYDAAARRQQLHVKEPSRSAPKPRAGGVPVLTKSIRTNLLTPNGSSEDLVVRPFKRSGPTNVTVRKGSDVEVTAERDFEAEIDDLKQQLRRGRRENRKLKEDVDEMTQERDFYYEKLRKIEEMCQDNEEELAYRKVLDLLYETDEAHGFVAPDEEGEDGDPETRASDDELETISEERE